MDMDLIYIGIMVGFLLLFHFFLRNINIYLSSFVLLPGTFFHEFSHYFVSLFTLGKPKGISLFPKKSNQGYTLGYVESYNVTWYNAFFIGMAPLILLPFSYFLYSTYEHNNLLFMFLIANLIYASIPSSVDFKVAFSFKFSYIILFGILYFFLDKIFIN